MKKCGIIPKHQVLDIEASAAYKQDIAKLGMSYKLVPPNNHRRNIAKKAIQTWKIILFLCSAAPITISQCICSAKFYHKQSVR